MKKLIVMFTLVTLQFLNGKSDNRLSKLKSELTSFDNIDQITPFNSLDSFNIEIELERQIDFGYVQHRLSVDNADLKLNFISKNGAVEIGWVSEYNFFKNKNTNALFFKNMPESLQNHIDKHNTLYRTDIDQDDFRN